VPQQTQTPTRRRSAAVANSAAAPKSRTSTRSAPQKSANKHAGTMNDAARREMIAVAAYYRAERRGFTPGDPLNDWVEAEAEIARMFPA
jgi:hypothetical protein